MKVTKICAMLVACGLLTACGIIDNQKSGNSGNGSYTSSITDYSKSSASSETSQSSEEQLKLEPNTPQSWIDLFTFTNVTIVVDHNLSILTDYEYRCVDGNWYYKSTKAEAFENHNGRDIFDSYLAHYSVFSFDKDNNRYKAEQWNADDSGYLRDVTIELDDNNRISSIFEIASNNSSELTTSFSFTNYGGTII